MDQGGSQTPLGRKGLVAGGLGGPEDELLEAGQEEVFSRAEVETGAVEHHAEAGDPGAPFGRPEDRKPSADPRGCSDAPFGAPQEETTMANQQDQNRQNQEQRQAGDRQRQDNQRQKQDDQRQRQDDQRQRQDRRS